MELECTSRIGAEQSAGSTSDSTTGSTDSEDEGAGFPPQVAPSRAATSRAASRNPSCEREDPRLRGGAETRFDTGGLEGKVDGRPANLSPTLSSASKLWSSSRTPPCVSPRIDDLAA